MFTLRFTRRDPIKLFPNGKMSIFLHPLYQLGERKDSENYL